MEQNDLQRALMAVLFAAGEPVDAKRLSQTLEHDEDEIHAACKALMDELSYTRSGIRIVRLENAYQMCSSPEMAEYVTKTLETRKPPKLSPSQLETLTVIAYYQPATRLVERSASVDSACCVARARQKAHPPVAWAQRARRPSSMRRRRISCACSAWNPLRTCRREAGRSSHVKPARRCVR